MRDFNARIDDHMFLKQNLNGGIVNDNCERTIHHCSVRTMSSKSTPPSLNMRSQYKYTFQNTRGKDH